MSNLTFQTSSSPAYLLGEFGRTALSDKWSVLVNNLIAFCHLTPCIDYSKYIGIIYAVNGLITSLRKQPTFGYAATGFPPNDV